MPRKARPWECAEQGIGTRLPLLPRAGHPARDRFRSAEGSHPQGDAAIAARIAREVHREAWTSAYDAGISTDDKSTALDFEAVIAGTTNYKGAANWVMGEVRSWVNDRGLTMEEFPITAERLAGVDLIDGGKVNHTTASQKLFPLMLEDTTSTAEINSPRSTISCRTPVRM